MGAPFDQRLHPAVTTRWVVVIRLRRESNGSS